MVQYAPNALGQATRADAGGSNPDAWGASYYPNGALKQFTYGNGIVHTLTQNARGLPERSTDAYGTTKFLDDAYDYDGNGNVAAISDGATGRNQRGNRDMSYDGLDRLTTVISPMYGPTGAAYGYDSLDNLTRVVLSDRNHYYCYDGSNRLTNVKTGGCGSGTTVIGLGYDVQGNLNNKNGVLYGFDQANRLRNVGPSPASSYVYDGQGRRVRDTVAGGSKYSQHTLSGQLAMTSDARAGTVDEYVYLAGSLLAIRERDTATNTYTVRYQHTDALGSPVVVTNGSRMALERREYEPYGRQLTPTPQDGPGYTGHVYDVATGLNYMQQRYYDPLLGRFLSVDPVTAYSTGDSRYFNRYWYAAGNPYKFTDPDGRATCADKNCEKSTIDSTLVRPGLLPPAVNGNESLSNREASLRETRVAIVTFQNDNPNGASPNQPVSTKTANAVEKAILDSGVSSVNVNSTTGGKHGTHSAHYQARAVDINRVNGQRVNPSNTAAARTQQAARQNGNVRENFGPTIMEKTTIPGGSPAPFGSQALIDAHQNHVHLSGQP